MLESFARRGTAALSIVAALLLVAPASFGEPTPSGDAAKQAGAKASAIDLSGLAQREKELFWKVAKGELCPCGRPESLARCLGAKPCKKAQLVAERLKGWVHEGLSYAQVVDKLILLLESQAQEVTIDLAHTPCMGPADAPVTVVSYSDFECPFCRKAASAVHDLVEARPGKVRHCFKHFPLSYHINARYAATVSLVMDKIGKFWPFHDKVFDAAGKDELSEELIQKTASELGVDLKLEERALREAAKLVAKDREEGTGNGVRGTPTFFVNGRPIPEGEPLIPAVGRLVEEELAKAGSKAPKKAPKKQK